MGTSVETKITNPIQHEILHPNSCIGLENGMRTGPNKRLPITVSQIKLGIAGIVVQWIVVKRWYALENLTPNLENKCLAIGACQCKMEIVGINAQWIVVKTICAQEQWTLKAALCLICVSQLVKIAQKCKEVFQNWMLSDHHLLFYMLKIMWIYNLKKL